MSEEKPLALVTGVSSGIGRAIAGDLAQAGYRVFGTVRSTSTALPSGVERVVLDVRDQGSIDAAVTTVLDQAGRIDVLVNNAGATLRGAIEETDTEQAQALFDVNFFGAVRLTRAVLPTMRAQGSGRLVFVSSVLGFLPAPFMGYYAASKHALEGYVESLDHEVRSLGVRALLVEPSYMKTDLDKNATSAARPLAAYKDMRTRVHAGVNAAFEHGDDPAVVAKAVLAALRAPRPRLRWPVGKRAGMLATLRDLLPATIFDRSLRKEFGLDTG
jgi:NAD(P)-dependent dehydrogenase (short-subunit alcohol dehydrogenase family)